MLLRQFGTFAKWTTKVVGSSQSFFVLIISTFIWFITGFYSNFSDTWQLYGNTICSIITMFLVVLIQYTQNIETKAINLKLDELIFSKHQANNNMINIENLSADELEEIQQRYVKIKQATD